MRNLYSSPRPQHLNQNTVGLNDSPMDLTNGPQASAGQVQFIESHQHQTPTSLLNNHQGHHQQQHSPKMIHQFSSPSSFNKSHTYMNSPFHHLNNSQNHHHSQNHPNNSSICSSASSNSHYSSNGKSSKPMLISQNSMTHQFNPQQAHTQLSPNKALNPEPACSSSLQNEFSSHHVCDTDSSPNFLYSTVNTSNLSNKSHGSSSSKVNANANRIKQHKLSSISSISSNSSASFLNSSSSNQTHSSSSAASDSHYMTAASLSNFDCTNPHDTTNTSNMIGKLLP
jgi:hypothetical protein